MPDLQEISEEKWFLQRIRDRKRTSKRWKKAQRNIRGVELNNIYLEYSYFLRRDAFRSDDEYNDYLEELEDISTNKHNFLNEIVYCFRENVNLEWANEKRKERKRLNEEQSKVRMKENEISMKAEEEFDWDSLKMPDLVVKGSVPQFMMVKYT